MSTQRCPFKGSHGAEQGGTSSQWCGAGSGEDIGQELSQQLGIGIVMEKEDFMGVCISMVLLRTSIELASCYSCLCLCCLRQAIFSCLA